LDNERRAKPLRLILSVLANPFVRSLGEWPNERKRALWQNPDVGFAWRLTHCLRSVFANGGSDLTGNSGRKTANVCDKHKKETIRNIPTDFTAVASSFFSGKRSAKFSRCSERGPVSPECRSLPNSSVAGNL